MDIVVRLQEDLPQSRFANWVVFQVELVKPMERVLVRVHIKGVNGKVVSGEVERLEHLFQRKLFAVSMDNHILDKEGSQSSRIQEREYSCDERSGCASSSI